MDGWEGKRHHIVRRVGVGNRSLLPSIFLLPLISVLQLINAMPRDLNFVSQISSRIRVDFNASISTVAVIISEKVQLCQPFP